MSTLKSASHFNFLVMSGFLAPPTSVAIQGSYQHCSDAVRPHDTQTSLFQEYHNLKAAVLKHVYAHTGSHDCL